MLMSFPPTRPILAFSLVGRSGKRMRKVRLGTSVLALLAAGMPAFAQDVVLDTVTVDAGTEGTGKGGGVYRRRRWRRTGRGRPALGQEDDGRG